MMCPVARPFIMIAASLLLTISVLAQSANDTFKKPAKPYKILTSGRQLTVKSTRNIKNVMVWTASGHRIVEQREINATTFTFNANVGEKIFFVMIQYETGKPYTEKIGVQ